MVNLQTKKTNNKTPSVVAIEAVNIVCLDSMYCYVFFNQVHEEAVRQAWGADISVGTSLLKIMPESADRIALKHKLDRALDGETLVEIKTYGDIEKREWESVYSPSYNPQRDIIGVTISSIDLTERNKAVREVNKKKKKLNYLFKNMTEGFALCEIICDENKRPFDYRILEVNKAYEQQCGIKGRDIVGKTVLEFFPDIEKSWIEIYGEVALTQKPYTFVNYNHNTERHYETSAFSPQKGQFALLFRDIEESKQKVESLELEIAERKKLQISLKESEVMFRALFEQAGGYCMILKPTDSGVPLIIDANEAACLEHGYTQNEMIGKPITDLDENSKNMTIDRTKIIMSGQPYNFETRHVRKDGSTFPVSVYANRIQISDKPSIIFTTEHNISKIKDAEEQRKHAEDAASKHLLKLSHLSRLETMREMATSIAHDLNQPLTTINIFASAGLRLVQGGNKKPAKLIDALEHISSQAMRAGKIIHRLRGYVQKEIPQMNITDLNTLIKEVVTLVEQDVNKQDIVLRLELTEQLPQVTINDFEIQQVLLYLIHNAIDAIQDSSSSLRELTVTSNLITPKMAAVTVTDTGIGIDKEIIKEIFEPFFTTKGNESLGVGLSISHSIIEAHGGKLSVQSQSGCGTVFSFTLPIKINQ